MQGTGIAEEADEDTSTEDDFSGEPPGLDNIIIFGEAEFDSDSVPLVFKENQTVAAPATKKVKPLVDLAINAEHEEDPKELAATKKAVKEVDNSVQSLDEFIFKKGAPAIFLAEAAEGSIVFKQGKLCSCLAQRHNPVSNYLSCGTIVCEQEREGSYSFCGALVLKEGSSYAGLSVVGLPFSKVAAEAYAKRLVDYDRNAATRTKVCDGQSDYYKMEGNNCLSAKEGSVLKQQQEEADEAAISYQGKVIIIIDLGGCKRILHKDGATEMDELVGYEMFIHDFAWSNKRGGTIDGEVFNTNMPWLGVFSPWTQINLLRFSTITPWMYNDFNSDGHVLAGDPRMDRSHWNDDGRSKKPYPTQVGNSTSIPWDPGGANALHDMMLLEDKQYFDGTVM